MGNATQPTPAASGTPGRHVIAAGAVVIRAGEVLVVHRPAYDDWSFPKGKVDPGEQVPAAAVREVAEETGLRIRLCLPLTPQQYPITVGTKEVHYWTGQVLGPDDVADYTYGAEIDEVAWVELDAAHRLLTHPHDRATLAEALQQPHDTQTLVVLRHARAVPRKRWRADGHVDDTARGLTGRGTGQAVALTQMLTAWGFERLLCSTSTRCVETVAPWRRRGEQLADPVEWEYTQVLSEEGAAATPVGELVGEALSRPGATLLCTHRPVVGTVLSALGLPDPGLEPGAALVVHHRQGTVLASELVPAPDA